MLEQDVLLLVVRITQNAFKGLDVTEELRELHALCETDEFFSTQLEKINDSLPEDRKDDILHAAKQHSKAAFLRVLNRLHQRKELTLNVLEDYKRQFGEDREILLAELTILFEEGYGKNQSRIDEIMKVLP